MIGVDLTWATGTVDPDIVLHFQDLGKTYEILPIGSFLNPLVVSR